VTADKHLSFRQGLRLAGHPMHAMLVHFPLALWFLVFPLELAARVLHWNAGWHIAFWANVLALLFSLPTMLTGLLEFTAMRDIETTEAANRHMYVMLAVAALFLGEALLNGGKHPPVGGRAFLNLGLSLAGTLLLTAGAWLGGDLVFRHGVGTRLRAPRD
jgi:uncharacterized membrane protein